MTGTTDAISNTGIRLAVAAIACGPVAATLAGCAFFIISGVGMLDPDNVPLLAYCVAIGAIFGWPATLFVGLPIHLWLRKHARTGLLWHFLAAPFAAALTLLFHVTWVVSLGGDFRPALGPTLQTIALHLGTALLAISIFWLISRPDRDPSPPPA